MSTRNVPQPIRGALGASSVGPRNIEIDRQNPDLMASPLLGNTRKLRLRSTKIRAKPFYDKTTICNQVDAARVEVQSIC